MARPIVCTHNPTAMTIFELQAQGDQTCSSGCAVAVPRTRTDSRSFSPFAYVMHRGSG